MKLNKKGEKRHGKNDSKGKWIKWKKSIIKYSICNYHALTWKERKEFVKKESEEGGYTRDKEGPKRGRRSIVN